MKCYRANSILRTIQAENVTLEPQLQEHAEEMFDVLSDPAIYKFLEEQPPVSPAWLRERYKKLETRLSPDGSERWLNWVVRSSSGCLLGYVQATVYVTKDAEIAFVFSSKFWGMGFAFQATQAMLEELVKTFEVKIVYATAESANARSIALLQRLGFSYLEPSAYPYGNLGPADVPFILRIVGELNAPGFEEAPTIAKILARPRRN